MGIRIDLTSQKFGRLTALKDVGVNKHRSRLWRCRCDCGNLTTVAHGSLRSGKTTSCGCGHSVKHGHTVGGQSKTYRAWAGMRARCTYSTGNAYGSYGGRGITVCRRWQTFKNFLADMGESPPGLSLDRINNNKGYSPENCRWATPRQQSANRRNTLYMSDGRLLAEAVRAAAISINVVLSRRERGWPESDWFLALNQKRSAAR